MTTETTSDPAFDLLAYLHVDITVELMDIYHAHGTCRATDGTYVCSLDVGHQGYHVDLQDRWVAFGVPHVVN